MQAKVTLTKEQYDILFRLVDTKTREIWLWRASLNSPHRDKEYQQLMDVRDALIKAERIG